MLAAYFTALKALELRETPTPQLRRPQDVLVRIDRVGVCGSDVHYYTHGRIGDQIVHYPATLGHECAGTIEAVGAAVERVRPGDRVAIDPALVCGTCDQCRAGRENTCRRLQFLGCPGEAPGAAAQWHVLPAENCFPIPPSMTLDEAALAEPLSIGLYAARLAELPPGAPVVIVGAGPIGLSVLLCAKALGAGKIYVTDLLDQRLEIARRCGADWTGNPRQLDIPAAIAEQETFGVPRVFECAGDPACVDPAQQMLAPGGTLVLVGIPPTNEVSFNAHLMRRKELTFKNVRRQRGCVGPVIDMIARRQIDPAPLLTHHFPLDRLAEAFELVADYRDGVIKAMVTLSAAK